MARNSDNLVLLSDEPELRVSAEDADPRGWSVVDAAQSERGRVIDLVVSTETMKAVYFVVQLADGRKVLLPASVARLAENEQQVIYDLLTPRLLEELPVFTRLPLSSGEDARIYRAFTGHDPILPDRSASADRRRRTAKPT